MSEAESKMDNRPLVIQVAQRISVSDGGPAKNAVDLDNALQTYGNVDSRLFWLSGTDEETVIARGVSPLAPQRPLRLRLAGKSKSTRCSLIQFLRHAKQADLVIAHGYFLWWLPILSALLSLFGTSFVIVPHGSLTARQQGISKRKKALFEFLMGWYVRTKSEAFIVYSESELNDLGQKFPDSRIVLSTIGIDIPIQRMNDNVVHSPVRLLSMSRIAPKKRIDLAIAAVKQLSDMDIGVQLLVAGSGDTKLLQTLKKMAHSLGVADKIVFAGELAGAEKRSAFLESDFFLLPSEDENFGIGFAEAMAYGLPSVVSIYVGSAESMPEEAGVKIEKLTPEDLTFGIVEALNKDYSIAQLAAHSHALQYFSWESVVLGWVELIKQQRKASAETPKFIRPDRSNS
ncbi:glycosyltransferase [Arthrobacter crystallopoietes]|uniref:glycosyltransferase n=1 Tax=Crystallibacter crystallopoietes TaxID=37928 RepID=UPI001ABEE1F2|nr:glycosyltransferase [Arthrobacter crystallopoietes]QTG79515.1 glycosyltransferase [Arthrobacter crystallopoietes]